METGAKHCTSTVEIFKQLAGGWSRKNQLHYRLDGCYLLNLELQSLFNNNKGNTMRLIILFTLFSILFSSQTKAAALEFSVNIDPIQEVPPSASMGSGMATVSLDDVSNTLCWDISWSSMSGPSTGMHFHGPAMMGVNAGVQVNIGTNSGLTSPSMGCTVITALQVTDLKNDLWYINIHSSAFPGGEIRGQVIETTPVELIQFIIE